MAVVFLGFAYSCQESAVPEDSASVKYKKKDFVLGEIHTIKSDILGEDRVLNVYLPAGFGIDPLKKYPVTYLLDGSKDEDFIHIVGLAQFANFPWVNMLEPTIIVGIANVDRKRDFTYPSQNEKDNEELPTSGGSKQFMDFIEKELQPYISSTFPTNNNKTIIGQSLGGLLASEILYKRPHLFTNYIIVSPSLWWDDKSLLDHEKPTLDQKKTLYLAVGKEGKKMESAANNLHDKLKIIGEEKLSIYFDYMEDFNHGNILHQAVYRAFYRFFQC